MYRLIGIFLLSVLVTPEAKKNAFENVVELQKLLEIKTLSYEDFHRLNAAHIIYNFYQGRAGGKVYLKSFHDLHYAGKIAIGEPGQILNVIFDIGSADVLVMSAAHCDTFFSRLFTYMCWTRRYFDERKSFKDNHLRKFVWKEVMYPIFQIKYEKATVQGILLFERIKVANVVTPPTMIGLMDDWKYGFAYSKADGIVGLGPRKLSKFLDGKWLSRTHENDKERIYSHLTLREQLWYKGATKIAFHLYSNTAGKEVGHLIIGAEDESWRIKDDLMWIDMSKYKRTLSSEGIYNEKTFKRGVSKNWGRDRNPKSLQSLYEAGILQSDEVKMSGGLREMTGKDLDAEHWERDRDSKRFKRSFEDERLPSNNEMSGVSSQVTVKDLDAEHWSLPLTTIRVIGMADGEIGGVTFNNIYSVLDPGTSLFAGPEELIRQINDQIFIGLRKAKLHEGSMEFDCRYRDQLPIISFVINDRGFLLEPKDYVKELKHSCSTGFMVMGHLPFFIIGDSFFRRYYTVFDFHGYKIGFAESKGPPA